MYYTVAYPKKFKGVGGGGQEYTLVLPGNNFFLRETIFVMWEPFGYFLYYAIMGTMRDPLSSCVGGGGAFLSLVGTFLGLPPPLRPHMGRETFELQK